MAGGGGGRSTTTTEIPAELKPLIAGSVNTVLGFQPSAQRYFTSLLGPWGPADSPIDPKTGITGGGAVPPRPNIEPASPSSGDGTASAPFLRQVSPFSGPEQQILSSVLPNYVNLMQASAGLDPNIAQWNTMNLNPDSPLIRAAGTTVSTPQAEKDFATLMGRGNAAFDVLGAPSRADTPFYDMLGELRGPSRAGTGFYDTQAKTEGLIGKRVGRASEEGAARQSYDRMSDIMARELNTPQAERELMRISGSLTGGSIGLSPATQEAIAALQNQFTTTTLPTLQNELAIAGLGRSGALGESVRRAQNDVTASMVPLLERELTTRGQMATLMESLARAQTERDKFSTETAKALLPSQATGLAALGGQIAGREQADIARDLQARQQQAAQYLDQQKVDTERQLGAMAQLLGKENSETSRTKGQLDYTSSMAPNLLNLAQQQQAREQLPIDRMLNTAINSAGAFQGMNQGQIARNDMVSRMAAMPRLQTQQELDALHDLDLRRQAMLESSIFGPLGVLPSLLGTRTTSSGGGK